MKLEPMHRREIHRCVEIEKELFAGDDPWNSWAFRSELDAGGYYLVARSEPGDEGEPGKVLGYAGLAVVGGPGEYEASLHTIGVDVSAQGRGIGTALLRGVLARADELNAPVFLEVRADNATAHALYERHGFTRIGVRKRYYQPSGADAYTMSRPPRAQEVAG